MNQLWRIPAALGLLTVLPVGGRWPAGALAGQTMAAYPLAGLVVGAVLAGLAWILQQVGLVQFAPLLAAVLVVAAWAAVTGALHLDGWSDCCDALLVPVDRARRLEIMADPRLGSFGATGLILLLLVKLAAVHALLSARAPGFPVLAVLLLIPALARWAVVCAAFATPAARPQGMAATFKQGLGRTEVLAATATVLIGSIALGWVAVVLWPVAALAMLAVAVLASRRLGGLTGDVYGAIVEFSETALLVAACLLAAPLQLP